MSEPECTSAGFHDKDTQSSKNNTGDDDSYCGNGMKIDDENRSIRIDKQFPQLKSSHDEGLLRHKRNTLTHHPIFGHRKC